MEPLSMLSLVMTLGSLLINTGKNHAEQVATNKQARSETDMALRAGSFDLQALRDQILQAQQSSTVQQFERQRQAMRDQSRLLVSAGEAGVGGNSILRSLAQEAWDTSYDTSMHKTNLQNQVYQTSQQAHSVYANMQSRVNNAQARIRNPWINTALGIATGIPTALEASQQYKGGRGK